MCVLVVSLNGAEPTPKALYMTRRHAGQPPEARKFWRFYLWRHGVLKETTLLRAFLQKDTLWTIRPKVRRHHENDGHNNDFSEPPYAGEDLGLDWLCNHRSRPFRSVTPGTVFWNVPITPDLLFREA